MKLQATERFGDPDCSRGLGQYRMSFISQGQWAAIAGIRTEGKKHVNSSMDHFWTNTRFPGRCVSCTRQTNGSSEIG